MADLAKKMVEAGGKLQVSRGRICESGCRRTRIEPKELQQTSRTWVPGTGYSLPVYRMLRRHAPMNGTLDAARVCRCRLIKLCSSCHTCRVYRTRNPRDARSVSLLCRGAKLPHRRGQLSGRSVCSGVQRPGVHNVTGLEPGLLKLRSSLSATTVQHPGQAINSMTPLWRWRTTEPIVGREEMRKCPDCCGACLLPCALRRWNVRGCPVQIAVSVNSEGIITHSIGALPTVIASNADGHDILTNDSLFCKGTAHCVPNKVMAKTAECEQKASSMARRDALKNGCLECETHPGNIDQFIRGLQR